MPQQTTPDRDIRPLLEWSVQHLHGAQKKAVQDLLGASPGAILAESLHSSVVQAVGPWEAAFVAENTTPIPFKPAAPVVFGHEDLARGPQRPPHDPRTVVRDPNLVFTAPVFSEHKIPTLLPSQESKPDPAELRRQALEGHQ